MSTEAIVLLIIAAVLLTGLVMLVANAPKRRARKELEESRQRAAQSHREAADARAQRAAMAEREAERVRLQQQALEERAQAERRHAELHQERAELHEQGEADHELARDDGTPLAPGYANEAEYADTARGDRDPRSERDVEIGGGEGSPRRFAREEPAPFGDRERAAAARDRRDDARP